jgi:hypothetical protein
MVEVFQNFFSLDEVKWFKQDMINLFTTDRVISRPYDPDESQRNFGFKTEVLDYRVILTESDPAFNMVRNALAKVTSVADYMYVAYQRQIVPHSFHVDELAEHGSTSAKSGVIPLDENTNGVFKTVIWDVEFLTNRSMLDTLIAMASERDKHPILSNVADVEHCWGGENVADLFPLDGIFDYEIGSIGMFPRAHMHCSSNWRKYGLVDYKDIIVIHSD